MAEQEEIEEKYDVGDKRINKDTDKVEICTEIVYDRDGVVFTWGDYDTILLESTWGQCCHSNELYPLSTFRANSMRAWIEKVKIENQIKIRYAYIGSPTNLRSDPTYYESLSFKVLTIEDLEQRSIKTTLEELITDGNEALIEVLGRDRCTGRVDMNGKDIYEGDIIRWYSIGIGHDQRNERVISSTCFYGQEPEIDCEVIGTIYDKKGNILL
jgi:hypothetical protein